jgi:hypothetical protein
MAAVLSISLAENVFAALERASAKVNMPASLNVEIGFTEDLRSAEERKANSDPEIVARSIRAELTAPGRVDLDLGPNAREELTLSLLRSDGTAGVTHSLTLANGKAKYVVTKADVENLWASEPTPLAPTVAISTRYAQLVPVGSVRPDFKSSHLALLPLFTADSALLGAAGVFGAFGFTKDHTSSIEVDPSLIGTLGQLTWSTAPIGVDGRFIARFEMPLPQPGGAAPPTLGWVWWLNGNHSALGFVKDDLSVPDRQPRIVPLPAFQPEPKADGSPEVIDLATPPKDVTETELVNNPDVYTEDPGAFCRPFSNPERVISEKSFAVVTRVEQPDISPLPSGRAHTQHLLDFDPKLSAQATAALERSDMILVSRPSREAIASALLDSVRPVRVKEPPSVLGEIAELPSGRSDLNAQHPLQWEDNIAQYQAATVALGHILEFRVRTRANGYSLGNVASTLTLAPRQTKRIQKIEFQRLELARREERTEQADAVNDEVARERDYNDNVSAYLSEWATGSSSSGTASAAGGIGFAVPPIVGGAGGGTSKAWSESTQSGDRHTGASEQQRLRDAIRRHGDALRRLQSTVVTEITQQESVTGTTEILRNPNYGHSLTVIYYQILRHLKVSTEFAGVRECLFVPFAIKPFTLQRAYRWREAIQQYLRQSRFINVMKHLRDVITNFTYSDMPPGTRAQ